MDAQEQTPPETLIPEPPPLVEPPPAPMSDEDDVKENKDIAALGYVWILSVLVFFSKRHSKFVAFHSKQGMVLFAISIVAWFIPFGIGKFIELLVLAGCAFGFIGAAQGEWKLLPLIGAISRRDKEGIRSDWRGIVDSMVVAWHGFTKTLQRDDKRHEAKPVAPSPVTPQPQPAQPVVPASPAPAAPPVEVPQTPVTLPTPPTPPTA